MEKQLKSSKMSNEIYVGVKFKTVFLSANLPEDDRLTDLKFWCNRFHQYNLAPPYEGGSSGNLSFRIVELQNEFIITGTKIGLKENLGNDKFVTVRRCDFDNHRVFVEGIKEPSSESFLHGAIYNNRPDINAIFHGHSEVLLKNSGKSGLIETKRESNYGTTELAESVLEILSDLDFFIIKNHGFVSLGKSIDEAGKRVMDVLKKCDTEQKT